MTEWLAANWGNILVISLIAIAVILAVVSIVRNRRAGKCSCGNCSGCAMAGNCKEKDQNEDKTIQKM